MNPANIEITRIFPKYDQGSIWEILLFIWKLIFSNCKNEIKYKDIIVAIAGPTIPNDLIKIKFNDILNIKYNSVDFRTNDVWFIDKRTIPKIVIRQGSCSKYILKISTLSKYFSEKNNIINCSEKINRIHINGKNIKATFLIDDFQILIKDTISSELYNVTNLGIRTAIIDPVIIPIKGNSIAPLAYSANSSVVKKEEMNILSTDIDIIPIAAVNPTGTA